MKNLNISEDFLEKTIDQEARGLVGRLLKRLEVMKLSISDKEKTLLKKLYKELIYESSRNLKWSLKAFSKGYRNQSITDFRERQD